MRKTPSWPKSWANFSLWQLHSHKNAWANLHHLGQPNTFLALANQGFSAWGYNYNIGPDGRITLADVLAPALRGGQQEAASTK